LHYRDPRPLIYIGELSGPGKSGRNLRMVVLSDQSLSGTLLYLDIRQYSQSTNSSVFTKY